MKKRLVSLVILCFCLLYSDSQSLNAAAEPAYAKWGRIAMIETKAKYPQAKIIDYLHIGRESGKEISIESFKLWLQDAQKEFGVFVNISFYSDTEEIIEITFQETYR